MCVCLFDRVLKGKRLELSVPKSEQMWYIAAASRAKKIRSKGHMHGYK